MKLITIFFALLALSLADQIGKSEEAIEDLEAAAASVELKRTRKETLESAASTYNNYVPTPWGQNFPNAPAQNIHQIPPQNGYVSPVNNNIPPQNDYVPPQNYPVSRHKYPAPVHNHPQNIYYPTKPTWESTTPVTVIKNEYTVGDNGSYKYEYKLSDGTWVGEEGYILYPGTKYENVVKKGWYSYKGADGKLYTVTWWADNTGYHAFGEHLPQQPSISPAIQADEPQQAEAENNKALYTTVKPLPIYTTQPQPIYPQPTYPQPTYPQSTYSQSTYPPAIYPHNNYNVNKQYPYATK